MLKEIKISNFAIIENLRIGFRPGLNVLTGETGAGKSILIDALNLILGGRADTDYIRSGQTSATVEAVFQTGDAEIIEQIRYLGVDVEDGELFIKRNVSSAGKNRCFLNDNSVTVATLQKIGARLIDIHGQHDHQALLRPETHIGLLDLYGKTLADRQAFGKHFSDYQTGLKQLEAMRAQEKNKREREDLLTFQMEEIDGANLLPEEEEELKAEKHKLRHAEKLHQSIERTLNQLAEAEGSALEQLGWAGKEMQSLCGIDPALEKQTERAKTVYFEIEELVEELRGYLRSIEFNPSRLEEIEDRLAEINGLKRKHGMDIASLLQKRDAIAAELDSLGCNQEKMQTLETEIRRQQKVLQEEAGTLAEKREKTAKLIKKSVEKELRDLNMTQVQFGVRFDYDPDPNGFVRFRGQTVTLGPEGIGTIEFLFSPNPGEELRQLAKIASGGELSRVMLALKSILNEQDPVAVMVFDEVDTGIGGKVAEQVGLKLKKVAAEKQVFCITHLPQIAGMASAHYLVQKTVKDNRTHSTIRELTFDERVEEIARMSGGATITPATLKHAEEMIKAAQ